MTTLLSYYLALAAELGDDFSSTATSGSTTSVLEDTAWPVQSTLDADDEFNNQIIWRPSAAATADAVRIVKSALRSVGQITPDHSWTNGPSGEAYHLLSGLAPVDGTSADMRTVINEGLKRCYWPVEVLGTPTALKTRHCMGTIASWLTTELMVLRVGYLTSTEDRNVQDPYARVIRGRIVRDGDTLYLDHYPQTFNATDVLYMEVLKPGYYQCRATGGTYGGQSGLSLSTDECPLPTDWVTASALVVAWRRLRNRLARNPDVQKNRAEAAVWFGYLADLYLNALPRTFMPVEAHFGPVAISGRSAFRASGF